MKEYGYDIDATHGAAIFELETEASNGEMHTQSTDGLIVGSSEWIWLEEDNAKRICAALKYFSETKTDDIEKQAEQRFNKDNMNICNNVQK